MKVSDRWKPQRSLAGLLGIFGASCVLFLAIGTDADLGAIFEKAAAVGLVAASAGYVCGFVLRFLIRELPDPATRESLDVPDSLAESLPKHQQPNSQGTVAGGRGPGDIGTVAGGRGPGDIAAPAPGPEKVEAT